jgi:hypothetical protein
MATEEREMEQLKQKSWSREQDQLFEFSVPPKGLGRGLAWTAGPASLP